MTADDQDGCEEADALAADEWRQNFISSAKYQNWVVETAKYYYNNGGKDMKKLFGVGVQV